MNKIKSFVLIILILFVKNANSTIYFEEYSKIKTDIGWTLYKKNDNNIYIQAIDLQKVNLNFNHGDHIFRTGKGDYFKTYSLEEYWTMVTKSSSNVLSITNGVFFEQEKTDLYNALSFPYKTFGKIWTKEFSTGYINQRKILVIQRNCTILTPECASIKQYSDYDFNNSENDVIVGLDQNVDQGSYLIGKKPNVKMGRTFVGTSIYDTSSKMIFIVNAISITVPDLIQELYKVGLTDLMMLDGNGSTQLAYSGNKIYGCTTPLYCTPDMRKVPQFLVVKKK